MRNRVVERRAALICIFCWFFVYDSYAFFFYSSFPDSPVFSVRSAVPASLLPRKIFRGDSLGLSKKMPSESKVKFEQGPPVLLPAGRAGDSGGITEEAVKNVTARSKVRRIKGMEERGKHIPTKDTAEKDPREKISGEENIQKEDAGEKNVRKKESGEKDTGEIRMPEQEKWKGRDTGESYFGVNKGVAGKELVLFKPELVLKTKYEMSTESGASRFTVRNSRVGLHGDIASYMSYRFLVELSGEGKFEVLDLYANIRPLKGLSVTFGQCSLPIYNSYTTSPSKLMFANRPFIGKYFSKSRDIGINVKYTVKQAGFPIAVEAGVYNGEGINNPKWTKTPSFGGRILFGDMQGFRATAKVYKSKQNEEENFFFWGADLRYEAGRFKAEAEVMDRYNKCDKRDLFSSYVQGAYSFPLVRKVIREIQPALRWDAMGYDFPERGFGVNRLTLGVNFVFNMKPFNSIFRIDYEQYFRRDDLEEFANSKEMDESKFTLELLIYF